MKWIWAIFTIIFLLLAYYHFRQSNLSIKHYEVKSGTAAKISGVSTGYKEFVDDFNLFIDQLNAGNKDMNLNTAWGYVAAAFTALISLLTSL